MGQGFGLVQARHYYGQLKIVIVPFEWLVKDNSKGAILLLWLNEDPFYYGKSKPLTKLVRLKRNFETKDKNVEFKVIGPTSSHTYLKMMTEILIDNVRIPPDMKIYSATATADDEDLLKRILESYRNYIRLKYNMKLINDKEYGGIILPDKETIKELKEIFTQRTKDNLEHTISSDKKLSRALIDELRHRSVNLLSPGRGDYVVLVSEWDTVYGRTLPETFKNIIREELGYKSEEKIPWVRRFSYLRGMDGKLPGEQDGSDRDNKKNGAGSKDDSDLKKLEEPIGKGQYDYLRRLAENICRLDEKLNREKKGSIKAIGVLGNDFYDKFLVLQALGQRLPGRIFFTTDLDARYLHPANIQWTRNLVVASAFGLQLHEDLQGDVPPFRDVYQTSVFAATLRAFDSYNLTKENFENLKPRIFEIGQRNALDLTGRSYDPDPINQAPPVSGFPNVGWFHFVGITVILSILGIIFWASYTSETYLGDSIKENAYFKKTFMVFDVQKYIEILIWLISFILLFIIVIFFYNSILSISSEEPLYLMEGISAWPTEFIRFTALILAILFMMYACKKLNDNYDKISKIFF